MKNPFEKPKRQKKYLRKITSLKSIILTLDFTNHRIFSNLQLIRGDFSPTLLFRTTSKE